MDTGDILYVCNIEKCQFYAWSVFAEVGDFSVLTYLISYVCTFEVVL